MDLVTAVNHDYIDIIITGTIKTTANTQTIKEAVSKAHQQYPASRINLVIKDSFIITSSVIGFLIKSIKMDKLALFVVVFSQELYDMLDDMNLIELLNVIKENACEEA